MPGHGFGVRNNAVRPSEVNTSTLLYTREIPNSHTNERQNEQLLVQQITARAEHIAVMGLYGCLLTNKDIIIAL